MEASEMKIDPKLSCKVCGEKRFSLREGFYYCDECGTKQDQVRAIEVDREDEFNQNKHLKKQKIKTVKAEEPELTSWECYNYILRGFVEELLSMGAKEQLKLMTLQVWAAYLRRLEVAFFNKKHSELPKLGVRFHKRDAKALYNHTIDRRKRRRRRTDDGSSKSGESSLREWRKNKRKLDESEYSFQTASQSLLSNESISQLSTNTPSTGGTTRAIQLKFSSLARKQFKKIMPIKHLKKHEMDNEGNLECHKSIPKVRSLHRFDHQVTNLNLKQIYAILAIALNLVEDDIELIDLVRFINEDRLSTKNVWQFFPENIVPHSKQLLTEIGFFSQTNKFTYKALREQTAALARYLCIREFRKPDINRLAKRYISELNLPDDVGVFVERLINLLPPKLETRATFAYPAYEARAMAYIIFVLKLLFGLDGHKEQLISDSATELNSHIRDIKTAEDKQSLLFVWSDWMEYVEMRKVIVAQYNRNFCHQFNENQSTAQLIAELGDEQKQIEENMTPVDATEKQKFKSSEIFANMKKFFEEIVQKHNKTEPETLSISFPPSFTPAHSYFKRVLLYTSSIEKDNLTTASVTIPEFMRTDHTQRSMHCFLQPKPLSKFFQSKGLRLEIIKAPCSSKRRFVGIFRPPLEQKVKSTTVQADFNITDEEWLEQIKKKPHTKELEFKTELESYSKKHIKLMEMTAMKKKHKALESEWKNINKKSKKPVDDIKAKDFLLPASEFRKKLNARTAKDNDDLISLHSIDVFNENDMEPIENISLNEPRRRYDGVRLFDDVSSDEESSNDQGDIEAETPSFIPATQSDLTSGENETSKEKDTKTFTFVTSNLDYWTLIGYISCLNDVQKKILESKFSRSFFWLLETCAQTIGVDWSLVYEQLLIIEMMFVYGIEPLDNFKDFIEFKPNIEIKDINQLILMFREIW